MRVYPFERRALGGPPVACVPDGVEQDTEPPLGLRMAEGRMEPRESGMRYDVDNAATRSASAFRPSSRTKADASAHFGV